MAGRPFAARLEVVAAAVLFSTGGAVVKATSLDGWQVAGLRSLVAAATLWLFMHGARRRWTARALAVGGAYAGMLIGFVLSSKLTTAANAVFLAATAPLYVGLIAPWWLGERWRRGELPFMAIMAAGLALCLTDAQPRFATAPQPWLGNLLAIGTGFFYALTVLGLRWLARGGAGERDAPAALVSGNLLAFAVCLPLALPLPRPAPIDLAVVLYLGAIQIGLAYIWLTSAMRRVPALEASLLLLIEPVLSSLLTWAVHGEFPGRWALMGAALILGSTSVKAALAVAAERRRVG